MNATGVFRLNTLTGVPLLRLLLANDGMEPPDLDLLRAWQAFKYFANLTADSEQDVVGFQGRWVGEAADSPLLACTWLRQLTDDAPGYSLTRAIELDYTLETPYNSAIEDVEIWSDSYTSVEAFLTDVEQLPHFFLLSHATVTMCDVYAEDDGAG